MGAVRTLLRRRDFRRLLAVRMTGQAGDGLFQAALFSAVFFDPERATSAGEAALGFATLLLPYSVVGPFAGVLLDRWRRQRVLLLANLLRTALLVGFSALLAALGPTSPPVVAVALAVVSLNRFVLSGLSASLPQVVDAPRLVTANSFTSTLGAGAAAVGGVITLGLRPLVGRDDAGAGRLVLFAGCLYLAAALCARTIAPDRLGPTDPPVHERLRAAALVVLRGLVQGAQHVRARGPAFRGLAAISAHRFFYGLSFVATLLLYTDTGAIGLGVAGLGQIVVAAVVGGLAAALVTPRLSRRLGTQREVVLAFAAAAVAEVVFGVPYTHPSLLIAALVLGFVAQASKICVDTLVQESVEDDFRGRVFSLYDTLFNVSFVSAAALAAVIVPDNGKSYLVIGVVAAGYAGTAAAYSAATARRADAEPPEPVVAR